MNQPVRLADKRPDRSTRIDTDPRFRRRRRAVVRSKRRRVLLGLGAIGAVGAITWTLFWSPLLEVRRVQVVGTDHLTEGEVADAAGLLTAHQNLLLLPTDRVAERVEALPWVREADVDRMLPGTVRIKITERRPAMVLSLGAARWTIDARGYVIATGEAITGLPVLAGIEVGDIEPGLRLMTEESTAALRVYRSLPAPLKQRISGIVAPTTERITLSLTNGTTVRYGAAEQLADKNEVLKVLLARLDSESTTATYIDVRVPTNAAVATQQQPTSNPTASPPPAE